ncbi:FadR/GntR family transcriptional regulator [Corynebacterium uterequi]|uniref:Transcriptional regulator n=1 Tax=Corynebacterium uterequi TaxID=1072256 RepID=A0A0G3HKY0_9CORY|nr:FCD domain-containing protein [Corynebacterium uterequi]AKK11762.1 transcriptional regulator [Corynebacterium uterequi]
MASPQPSSATPLLTTVLESLGQRIVSGELQEGHTFTLQTIGDRFGISRTVAREAMRALEQLGLVASSRRVGITVLPRSNWAVFDPQVITWRMRSAAERPQQLQALTELRIAVEPIAAFNAAIHATDAQRAELLELAAELRRLGEDTHGKSSDFLRVDIRFHSLLLEASGNEMFIALIPSLLEALYGRTEFGLQPASPAHEALDAHDALAQAISSGDASGAEEQSRLLISEVRAALRRSR